MTVSMRLAAALVCLAGVLVALPATGFAEPLSTRYSVSLIGLPVGQASFDTDISPTAYRIEGTLGSTGLADIFSTVKGTSSVSGRIAGDRLYASRYGLDYASDKRRYRSDIVFRSGRVASAKIEPKVKPRVKDYVPVQASQLRSVVDPLSGLMIRAKDTPEAVCGRTLPFFDGWSRLDLRMTPAGRKPFSTDGFSGDAIVCNVRIAPVSGYKPTSSGLRFIQRQTVEIWFAPIRDTGLFAPVYARVPTEVGPLTFRATAFAKG